MFNFSSKSLIGHHSPVRALALILSALVLSLGLIFIAKAWTEPSQAPPGGNIPAPLNVSGTAQTKTGRLQLGNSATTWLNDSITGFSEPVVSNDGFVFIGGYTGVEDSDLRLYMLDNATERFSIWGNSCGGGDCGDLNAASLAHYFTAAGNAWHRGDLTADRLCLNEGEGCKNTWSDISGTSYWTKSGSNLYPNNTGWEVGIGTANPGAKLDVNGNIKLHTGRIRHVKELGFDWTSGQNYNNPQYHGIISSINGGSSFSDEMTVASYDNMGLIIDSNNNNSASKLYISHHSTNPTANPLMVVESPSGNVGIGTANPQAKLDVEGGLITRGRTRIGYGVNGDLYSYGDNYLGNSTAEHTHISGKLCLENNTNGANCRYNWPSGGIGSCSDCDGRFVNVSGDTMTGDLNMSSPSQTSDNNLIKNTAAVHFVNQETAYVPDSESYLMWDNSEGLMYYHNGAWRTMLSNYRAMTRDLNVEFHNVYADCFYDNQEGSCITGGGGENLAQTLDIGNDANNRDIWDVNQLSIDYLYKAGSGNIHMRDHIDFDNRDIYDANEIYADKFNAYDCSTCGFFYTSDIALKKDIAPLENSLEKVLNLEGVSFDWKENGEPSIGLIAQDVEQEFPEAVITDSETGMKSIDYGKLIAPMVESIKEQQQEIKKLQTEVKLLKQQLNK